MAARTADAMSARRPSAQTKGARIKWVLPDRWLSPCHHWPIVILWRRLSQGKLVTACARSCGLHRTVNFPRITRGIQGSSHFDGGLSAIVGWSAVERSRQHCGEPPYRHAKPAWKAAESGQRAADRQELLAP